MESIEDNSHGNTIFNNTAEVVHNNAPVSVSKPQFNIQNATINYGAGTSRNPVPILENQSNQESAPSGPTLCCILREKVQELYKRYTLPKVAWMTKGKTLPLNEYYVELQLGESSQLIKMEEIFDQKHSRILIEGQPGHGKTTMAIKLAYDWANNEKYISHFKLVFLFRLRELQRQTIEDCIAKIGNRCGFERKDILKTMEENKQDVLFIFDGLDELSDSGRYQIARILFKQRYSNVAVVALGRSSSFVLTPEERTELLGVPDADDIFYDNKLSILGIRDIEKKKQFIKKFLEPSMDVNIIENLSLKGDLFDSPLFLILLPVIIHENKYIQPTSKTDFYKQFFNCIIKQSYINRNRYLATPFDLFLLDPLHKNIQDIVYEFGKMCFKKIIKNNLQFESSDLMEEVYNIGLLAKHMLEINNFDTEDRYEAFHLTIIEFAAAVALWMDFKFDKATFTETLLKPIVSHFIQKSSTSLVLPFVASLMDEDLDVLLLRISNSFYFQRLYIIAKLFAECSKLNIENSKHLKMLISPYTVVEEKTFDVNNSREIINYGLSCGQMKIVCLFNSHINHPFELTEVINSSLIMCFNQWFVIQVSSMPHEDILFKRSVNSLFTCMKEEMFFSDDFPNPEWIIASHKLISSHEIKVNRILECLMALESKTCLLRVNLNENCTQEVLVETEKYKTIKYQYLSAAVRNKLEKTAVEKLIKNNQVQFFSLKYFYLNDTCLASCFAMSAYLTSIELSGVNVDLFELTNGGRKKYDHIILCSCTVTCRHSLSKKNCCDYLKIFDLQGVEVVAELEPIKLEVCEESAIELSNKCPTWAGFSTVKYLSLIISDRIFATEFYSCKNLETLSLCQNFGCKCCDEIMLIEFVQKIPITKLIIYVAFFSCTYNFWKLLNSVCNKHSHVKSIDLIIIGQFSAFEEIVNLIMMGLKSAHISQINLIFEDFNDNKSLILTHLTKFSVSYRIYGLLEDDEEQYKIRYQYQQGLENALAKCIVINVGNQST